ncbi:MAG TPA: PQQ-dependent sugar dehydrogenase, partial [Fodinibius sp.]|nr:PQQ-dependent sugar dehydrogenase [Fodinibius sp.]
ISEANDTSGAGTLTIPLPEKTQELNTDGEQIYREQCAACHQQNGKGVSGLYPPLGGTEWVTGDKGRLIRIILQGIGGSIEVKGNSYTGLMPPWKDILSDDEVAAVASYLRSSWGNSASTVSEDEVRRVRAATESRQQPWTAAALNEEKHTGVPEQDPHAPSAGPVPANEQATKEQVKEEATPPAGSFKKEVLVDEVTRANVLDIAPDGRVFFAEREGAVRIWDPRTESTQMAGFIPVSAIHTSGLLGLVLDPNFNDNSWIYLYYSPASDDTKNELARFTIDNNRIQPGSKQVILEVPTKRDIVQAHSAGDLTFGPHGNLFLSTGDHANPTEVQLHAPLDERPGREDWDAQRTSGNTNNLEGMILRIRPQPDGSYTIPNGNLFPPSSRARPEIYVMGNRNPFRISVDPQTGWLYWGDVGPGAPAKDDERGPMGHDEFNQAREAGNFGWPYFVADNRPYRRYDFATGESGAYYNPEAPVNNSPNNTGFDTLPPAEPAMIWYPKGKSDKFPELGTGGHAAMAGPVYRFDAETVSARGLPASYEGKLFIYDFMRNWIMTVTFDDNGDVERIDPFLPDMEFNRPMDLEVASDGTLYVIEWGSGYEGWYNDDAQIVRLEYQGTGVQDFAPAAASPSASDSSLDEDMTDENRRQTPEIEWPVTGGIFEFNQPLSYRIAAPETTEAQASSELLVQPLLAHDTHKHRLESYHEKEGTFLIPSDTSHFYLEDQFAVLKACYADTGAAQATAHTPFANIMLQP